MLDTLTTTEEIITTQRLKFTTPMTLTATQLASTTPSTKRSQKTSFFIKKIEKRVDKIRFIVYTIYRKKEREVKRND